MRATEAHRLDTGKSRLQKSHQPNAVPAGICTLPMFTRTLPSFRVISSAGATTAQRLFNVR